MDALIKGALHRGWALLFPDRHPHIGGKQQRATYLENSDGFAIELVARGVRMKASAH